MADVMSVTLLFMLACMLGCGYCAYMIYSPKFDLFRGHLLKDLLRFFNPLFGRTEASKESPEKVSSSKGNSSKHARVQGAQPGWLKVLTPDELFAAVGAWPAIHALERESKLDAFMWQRDLRTAIHRYAELVQLMPASEAHHHAHAGGLLAHTLEVLLSAMKHRNAVLLPQGATIEHIDRVSDHWTYVVFFAALLHDVGKPLTDLRITWTAQTEGEALGWSPLGGSLKACGAVEYHVAFTPKPLRNYTAHSRSAILLLKEVAPPSALSFLASHPPALDALSRYLSGEDRQGFLAELIKRADVQSAKQALLHGSRSQFPTAGTTPLVACLMDALRQLLRDGVELPLNRDGAAGWVYDDSVWFVSKRLVEQLRKHLSKVAPDLGVPSDPSKVFDVFQDYQEIVINSDQAIWSVTIHGEEGGKNGSGYVHDFQVLRFHLDKLWPDASLRPAPMRGRVEVLSKRPTTHTAKPTQQTSITAKNDSTASQETTASEQPQAAQTKEEEDVEEAWDQTEQPDTADAPITESPAQTPQAPIQTKHADKDTSPRSQVRDERRSKAPAQRTPHSLLDDIRALGRRATVEPSGLTAEPSPISSPVQTLPNPLVNNLDKTGLNELGLAFFKWLQTGIADGEISINKAAQTETRQPASMVHVLHNGLGLVTPRIYETFAQVWNNQHHETQVSFRQIQKAAIEMGHYVESRKSNIHTFGVFDKDDKTVGTLHMHVFEHPSRYLINNLPPINKAIRVKAAQQRN